MRYQADITAGSLKAPESRGVADLLLRDNLDAVEYEHVVLGLIFLQSWSSAHDQA